MAFALWPTFDFFCDDLPYPSPSIYWILWVRAFFQFDPWAAISYGQNLERQGFGAACRCFCRELMRRVLRIWEWRARLSEHGGCGKRLRVQYWESAILAQLSVRTESVWSGLNLRGRNLLKPHFFKERKRWSLRENSSFAKRRFFRYPTKRKLGLCRKAAIALGRIPPYRLGYRHQTGRYRK
jgi:hypothetical protein